MKQHERGQTHVRRIGTGKRLALGVARSFGGAENRFAEPDYAAIPAKAMERGSLLPPSQSGHLRPNAIGLFHSVTI